MVPLISCIIPSYNNNNNKVLYALESLLKQDYPRIEIILSDDGSDSYSKSEIEKFICDNKKDNIEAVKIIIHPINIGTVRNLNAAYSEATGDYYITLAADDVFFADDVITKIVERFIETKEDLIACARMKCDKDLNPVEIIPNENQIKKIKALNTAYKQYKSFITFDFHDIASGSAMYFSKSFFEKYGKYDEKYRLWEDGPKLAEYTKAGKKVFGAYDIVSIKYRDGGVSASKYVTPSGVQLGKDHSLFIKEELIPNKKGTNLIRRRNFMFQYYWENTTSSMERIVLLLHYPEKAINIVKKKLNW